MSESKSQGVRSKAAKSDALKIWAPFVLIALVGVALVAWFIEPAPPERVRFAAGAKGGAHQQFARRYADFFATRGIHMDVLETAGSLENAALLTKPDGDVDAALLQGGTVQPGQREQLEAVVAVFFEPLWVFVPAGSDIAGLEDMRGKRINVGSVGSGTRALALDLLLQSGITAKDVTLVDESVEASTRAMEAGSLDALFLVVAPNAPVLVKLLESGAMKPLTLPRLRAFARRDDSLSVVTLYEGSIDPARDLPREDLTLLASSAVIAVRPGTHQAVVQLLVLAATEVHRGAACSMSRACSPTPPRPTCRSTRRRTTISRRARHFCSARCRSGWRH